MASPRGRRLRWVLASVALAAACATGEAPAAGPSVTVILPLVNGRTSLSGTATVVVDSAFPQVSVACKINGGTATCDSLHWDDRGLGDGDSLVITATATDLATGRTGRTATARAVIDARGPSIDSILPSPDSVEGPVFTARFSTDDPTAAFTCSVSDVDYPCTPGVPFDALGYDGANTFVITGTDLLGNRTTAMVLLEVDAVGPTVVILSAPTDTVADSSTDSTAITFHVSDPNPPVRAYCDLDAGGFFACDTTAAPADFAFTWFNLADGPHQLTIKGRDRFNNTGSAVVVDFVVKRGP